MSNDSRSRMVQSAASMIGSRGVNATSFSEVVADSGAPRGSIYHHFPEGKRQLAEEAVQWTAARVLAFQSAAPAVSAHDVLRNFMGMWRNVVLASAGASGCVAAGVAIDTTAVEDGLMHVVRETFRSWVVLITEQLESFDVPAMRARSIAMTTLAAMEGALILCRAEGNVETLDLVAEEILGLLD